MKLFYTPEQGLLTRFRDGVYTAPDGSRWQAVSGRWVRNSFPAVIRKEVKQAKPKIKRQKGSPAMALFGFFAGMGVFAKPVSMTFPDLLSFFGALLPICCACAYLFYRVLPALTD